MMVRTVLPAGPPSDDDDDPPRFFATLALVVVVGLGAWTVLVCGVLWLIGALP